MNNIQKNFKQKSKRGLCMAIGGVVDPYEGMTPADVAQYTNDPDALNKASTLKWAADERQRQASHPGQAFLNPAQAAPAPTQPALAAAPAPTPTPLATPTAQGTTFEQDIDARDSRIRKLRDSLSPRPVFADGGIVGADGLTDAQRAKLSGVRSNLGVSNAPPPSAPPAPAAAPAPVRTAPAPTQQPSVGGAINSIRERQRMLSNLANGGILDNAAEYWADDNAQFEKTNPEFADRVVRALNPMTGFGSAMGAMHTAASSGDVPGMVMAGATAIPAFGVLRAVPAVGAAKATVAPSLRKTMASLVGGATANAASDEYQSKNNSGLATGGVVGAKTFEFEGKGTGTSDDIPVKVAGNHVNVSNGEKAVILPAKTAQNPQALDMIEDVIEQTNGKPPNRGLRGNFNVGGFVDDYGNLRQPNRFQKAVPNEILRQQVNNAAPGAQLRPDQTAAMAEKAAAARPLPVVPKAPTSALTKLGRAATVAGVVGNGIDMATSDIPAEQVAAGIRGASMANPLLGTAVNVGDALVDKATGGKYNMATGLDAAAKWASENVPGMRGDYMLPPEFQPGGTGKAAPAAPAEAPTAEEQAANRAVLLPAAPQTSTPANFVPEAVASNTPKLDAEVARRGLSGLKTIGTTNGDVTTGRDKNGQLHVMAGLDNTDAQNEALRAKEADRMTKDLARQVQVFDGLRAERLQGSNDPADRAMGLAQAQQQILQQQARNAAAHNDATTADAEEGRSIQRATLEQQNDQFSKTLAAATATAKAAAAEAGIKDFDKLVEDSGLPKEDQTPFRDWFRGNYAGRKQKGVDGKEVDVPGFEDMSADEKRAHMTNALAQYALVKQLRATEMNGNESMMPPANLTKRDIGWSDVKRNAAGLPVINSGDPNHPGLLGDKGYLARAWLPKWVGGPSDQVMEEKDPKTGKTIRKWLAENTKGNKGPWGNMDTAAYMEGLQAKK